MSGDQEPWVFRGGLTADLQVGTYKKLFKNYYVKANFFFITNILQRLIPVDSGNDLFVYKTPEVPVSKIYTIRPYLPSDEESVYRVCNRINNSSNSFAVADR